MLTNNASDMIKPFQLLLDNYLYTNGASQPDIIFFFLLVIICNSLNLIVAVLP